MEIGLLTCCNGGRIQDQDQDCGSEDRIKFCKKKTKLYKLNSHFVRYDVPKD